jgi:MYXO-CTERM domain-containing protein
VSYSFEEGSGTTTADLAGGNNNGTLGSGATFFGSGAPNNGGSNALSLDATANSSVSISAFGGLLQNAPGLTIAGWVRPTALGGSGSVSNIAFFSNGTSATSARAALALLSTGNNTAQVRVGGRSADTDTFRALSSGATTIGINNWAHIAGTIDYPTRTLTVYINGVQAATSTLTATEFTATSTSNTTSLAALIGARPASPTDERFTGQIDNLQVYNETLSPTQIAALVPEPTSASVVALAGAGLLAARRRRISRC